MLFSASNRLLLGGVEIMNKLVRVASWHYWVLKLTNVIVMNYNLSC